MNFYVYFCAELTKYLMARILLAESLSLHEKYIINE